MSKGPSCRARSKGPSSRAKSKGATSGAEFKGRKGRQVVSMSEGATGGAKLFLVGKFVKAGLVFPSSAKLVIFKAGAFLRKVIGC